MFFERLEQTLQAFDVSLHFPSHHQAAVLLLITDEPQPHLIYAKRAAHLKSHANEICFPGGKWEAQDASLAETALRETEEELGVKISAHQLLGVLPARSTRKGVSVLPLVARVAPTISLVPDSQELSEVFRVPIFSLNQLIIRIDQFERAGLKIKVPVYAWGEHEIWGFTAAVTQDLLKLIPTIMSDAE